MGASTGAGRRRGPIVDINVTPLVDVVLVLLIIFMVVADLGDKKDSSIPIELPGAGTAQALPTEPFTVSVDAAGNLVLLGKLADVDAVRSAVRDALQSRGADLEVVVAADGRTQHLQFVALLDMLRAEGVSRFAIQTESDGASGG